jgi:hypothetical protein
MGFILLHMLDGKPIYVRPEEIIAIGHNDEKLDGTKVGSRILLHEKWFSVIESQKEIVDKVDGGD